MATQTKDEVRIFEAGVDPLFDEIPAVASDIIYEGSAVGISSGNGRPLVAADVFAGFCDKQVDNSLGAAGAKKIRIRRQGVLIADVVGVTAATDRGSTVYMSDDNTFTLTSTSNTAIGKVGRFISGTKVAIFFQAADVRSI